MDKYPSKIKLKKSFYFHNMVNNPDTVFNVDAIGGDEYFFRVNGEKVSVNRMFTQVVEYLEQPEGADGK